MDDNALQRSIVGNSRAVVVNKNGKWGFADNGYSKVCQLDIVVCKPADLRRRDVSISAGFSDSPFGRSFVAWNERGIFMLSFVDMADADYFGKFQADYDKCRIARYDDRARVLIDNVFALNPEERLTLCLSGTPFQVEVWKALSTIPFGEVVSYGDVAKVAGNENAVRAAASAVGSNPVGFLIPCHRVIRSNGELGQFGWGAARKAGMLEWEMKMKAGF